jgi:dynamin 1-like protein
LSEPHQITIASDDLFYNFDEIRAEIERVTDAETGKNKGVSKKAINLKIYSPHVINLTLVDLPGMTRVPIGDQPADIEVQIREMILAFIKKPSSIILAVTAANTDLSNSDALNLARMVDPDGNRTIGVLTKIDIMDKGTNAMDVLLNKVIPLQMGYVGIINRSQEDITRKVPIRDALRAEAAYFKNHALYRSISSRCGTQFLAKSLNKILMHHIRDALPELKSKISKMLAEAHAELAGYGDAIFESPGARGALLLQIITKFCNNFAAAIDGNLTTLSTTELYGGARINFIFNEIFGACLARVDPLAGLTLADVKTTIRNATGPKAALFVPESSFELLVKRQIARLQDPSLACVDLVYDELQRIVAQVETKELARFGRLRQQVIDVVGQLLHSLIEPTKRMIADLVAIELAFINTSHPDFIGGDGALSNILDKMVEDKLAQQQKEQQRQQQAATAQQAGAAVGAAAAAAAAKPALGKDGKPLPSGAAAPGAAAPASAAAPAGAAGGGFMSMLFGGGKAASAAPSSSQLATSSAGVDKNAPVTLSSVPAQIKASADASDPKETFETQLIQNLLTSYFDVVRKNIGDLVPKSIIHFLVNRSKQSIQNELVRALYKEEMFDDLLEENSEIAARRKACVDMVKVLEKASSIINEVRELGSTQL